MSASVVLRTANSKAKFGAADTKRLPLASECWPTRWPLQERQRAAGEFTAVAARSVR